MEIRDFRFWPDGWRELDFEPERAEIYHDLLQTLTPGHVLDGRLKDAIACEDESDIVLFELIDGRVAEVVDMRGDEVAIYETIWTWIDAVTAKRAAGSGVQK